MTNVALLVVFLALTMGSTAGCSAGRRLGSKAQGSNDHSGRDLHALDVDDAQPLCGTHTPSVDQRLEAAKVMDEWAGSGRKLQSSEDGFKVPVYFWHTYSPGTPAEQVLSAEMIESLHFAALRQGFRDTPFEFELQGIEIVESADFGTCERLEQSEYDMKKTLRVAGKNVLNIYICDSTASDSRAWSSFPIYADIDPLYDGVVIRNPAMVPALDKRETAIWNVVHEAGHFFGLLHTFEGGCTPKVWNSPDGTHTEGDGVEDTAHHAGPTNAISPGSETCWLTEPPIDTCKNERNGIDKGIDPVRNFMNYLPGSCMKEGGEFTPGQIARMVVQFETFRTDKSCRQSGITCTTSNQCCAGLTCKGGNDQKMKCK